MKKRILVVDDDASIRESLKKVLEESGYEVLLTADGHEAEQRFTSEAVDLVLLDLDLPKQDGWDVFGIISSQAPLLPVIFITGLADQLDTTIIPGIGGVLEKPIDVPVLLKKIQQLLAQSVEERLSRATSWLDASHGAAGYARLGSRIRLSSPAKA